MRRPHRAWVVAAAGGLASASGVVAAPTTTQAAETPPVTVENLASPKDPFSQLPLEEQIRILTPLRAVGYAVEEAARSAPDTYSGLRLKPMDRAVDVYVTDGKSAEPLLADAKRIDPAIDLSLVRVHTAPYSRALLTVAMSRLGERHAAGLPYRITSVGVLPDGTGLAVRVEDLQSVPEKAARIAGSTEAPLDPSSIAGVPTFIEQQAPLDFTSRIADEPPYQGGAFITVADNQNVPVGQCTVAIPAIDNETNYTRLVTAAHCARNGDVIYTGGGHKQGIVYDFNTSLDAAVYPVGSVQGRTWLGPDSYNSISKPFSRAETALVGDRICNGGVVSGMVCDSEVVLAKTAWGGDTGRFGYQESYGPEAHQVNGQVAVRSGDSGGPVFSHQPDGTVALHGVVSHGGGSVIRFTNALQILQALNLRLAP